MSFTRLTVVVQNAVYTVCIHILHSRLSSFNTYEIHFRSILKLWEKFDPFQRHTDRWQIECMGEDERMRRTPLRMLRGIWGQLLFRRILLWWWITSSWLSRLWIFHIRSNFKDERRRAELNFSHNPQHSLPGRQVAVLFKINNVITITRVSRSEGGFTLKAALIYDLGATWSRFVSPLLFIRKVQAIGYVYVIWPCTFRTIPICQREWEYSFIFLPNKGLFLRV